MESGHINRDGLLALYTYNVYANRLVLETAAALSEEALARAASPSHTSVRNLLLHMLGAEAGFLERCQGRELEIPDLPTVELLHSFWDDLAIDRQSYIASLDEPDLAREVRVELLHRNFRFPVWQLLLQALIHSTHHRGELSIVLTELGHPLPTLDAIIHFANQSGQAWPLE